MNENQLSQCTKYRLHLVHIALDVNTTHFIASAYKHQKFIHIIMINNLLSFTLHNSNQHSCKKIPCKVATQFVQHYWFQIYLTSITNEVFFSKNQRNKKLETMFALGQYQTNYFSLKVKKPIYCKLHQYFCEHQRFIHKYNPIEKCALCKGFHKNFTSFNSDNSN